MTLVELLKSGWCKSALARDQNGDKVRFDDPQAVKWCLEGGCLKVYGDQAAEAMAEGRRISVSGFLDVFNDAPETTLDDVLAVAAKIDEAMKKDTP